MTTGERIAAEFSRDKRHLNEHEQRFLANLIDDAVNEDEPARLAYARDRDAALLEDKWDADRYDRMLEERR